MSKNSFKELENLYIQERNIQKSATTKGNIESNMHTFKFISDLIELYIPKVGKVIQSLSTPIEGKNK